MKNTTTIFDIFQTFLAEEEVKKVSESLGYVDTARKLKSFAEENSSVVQDIICYLGTKTKKTQNRFRVVEFTDYHGKSVKVCADLMDVTPEKIANIYKECWKIETFFKFIKQNLNVKRLFGTTQNAVYNQLFIMNFYKENITSKNLIIRDIEDVNIEIQDYLNLRIEESEVAFINEEIYIICRSKWCRKDLNI